MKILIGADLVPTSATEKYFIAADTAALYGDLINLARNADRIVVNLECALTVGEKRIRKFGPNLKASPEAVNGIKALGVTDAALSNNHVFDYGTEGLRDTMATLDAAGIPYMGVGENDTDSRRPYFIEQDGVRVGFINVCEHEYTYATPTRLGANPFDPFLTMQDIREAKKQCKYLIVIYHGGKEHCQYPSPRLYNLAHEMVLCGADAVIMQHSHCIGCYEQFEGGHIVYGQGNFNFVYDAMKTPLWNKALLVELELGERMDIRFHPIVGTETGCDLAKGEAAREILLGFMKRNASLKDGSWREGWHEFCTHPDRSYYHEVAERALDTEEKLHHFAHYLDCEAHTDVWRELYPTWNATNE